MHIAIATRHGLPDWEVDDAPLHAALARRGVRLSQVPWDDAGFDWSGVRACLIRTPWDYSWRRDEFVQWADRAARATTLFNPASVVRWNTDKRYLHDLERRGVPVIPTVWLERGSDVDVGAIVTARGWARAFLKPVVGAAARGTLRFDADAGGIAAALAHLGQHLPHMPMMLQPYLSSVETEGEYSVIFFDGRLSHAVQKIPVPGDYRVQDDHGASDRPADLAARELELAAGIVGAAEDHLRAAANDVDGRPLLYARVDLIRDEAGDLRLTELEIVEPSLFFRHGPGAADMLADALLARLG